MFVCVSVERSELEFREIFSLNGIIFVGLCAFLMPYKYSMLMKTKISQFP